MTEEELLHEVDDQLIGITKKSNLLKYLTPTNLTEEREHFVAMNGDYDPQFSYNFPDEKDIISRREELQTLQKKYFDRKIYENKIGKLLSDKLEENLLTVHLLLAYKKQDFVNIAKYNTLLFGDFDPKILQQAEEILQSYQEPKPEIRGAILTGNDLQQAILDYMKRHTISNVLLTETHQSLSKFVIGFGKNICRLYYAPTMKIREHVLEADLIHELGVHYARHMNGKKTGRNVLAFGTKHYLTDEEGLALYQVCAYRRTFYPAFQKIGIYQKYLLLQYAQEKSFRDVGRYIQEKGRAKNLRSVFTMTMRCKQGIQNTSYQGIGNVFLKNKLYADGYYRVDNRVAQGHNLGELLQAKLGIDDLPYLAG